MSVLFCYIVYLRRKLNRVKMWGERFSFDDIVWIFLIIYVWFFLLLNYVVVNFFVWFYGYFELGFCYLLFK